MIFSLEVTIRRLMTGMGMWSLEMMGRFIM